MAIIPVTTNGIRLLAQLMRAEALSDGNLAMLMVGNVGVNRVYANCLDFKNINNIQQMVFQDPGGFTSTKQGFFYHRPTAHEKTLARKAVRGKKYYPASYALWFFKPGGNTCPTQWFGQWNTGKYKSFCYFHPTDQKCPHLYSK